MPFCLADGVRLPPLYRKRHLSPAPFPISKDGVDLCEGNRADSLGQMPCKQPNHLIHCACQAIRAVVQ